MKILCVIDSLGSGGAQRQLVGLAVGLKEKGNDVSFLVYHDKPFFKGLLDEAEIPIVTILENKYFRRLLKIRNYIRKGHFDAVLSFLEAPNFICEIAGFPWRRWKLVVGERSANPAIITSFKRRVFRYFHIFADYIVTNSHENLNLVRKVNPLLNESKCKVIYNMVDFETWKYGSNYIPLRNGKLNLTVAASHQYLKNAKGLIQAVAKLKEEEKCKLIINWYGDERGDNSFCESKKLVEGLGLQEIFLFHKASSRIVEKLQQADVVGLFSFYEGLPNVICEAMVLAKTVVSSNVSDIPKFFKKKQWCTFNPVNAKDIQRVLSYILALSPSELLKIGNENRKVALSLFNKDTIVSTYEILLS